MFIHLFLSNSAMERILKLRLLAEFRPTDEPIPRPGLPPCYIDGIEIESVTLSESETLRSFQVGEFQSNEVKPVGQQIFFKAMNVSIVANVLLSPLLSVRAAGTALPMTLPNGQPYGLPDRPPELRIRIISMDFDLFFTVTPAGDPRFNIELRQIVGAELLGDAQPILNRFRGLTLPFAVNAAFKDFLYDEHQRVLAAGMKDITGGFVMRFEYGPVATGWVNQNARLIDWNTFFTEPFPSPFVLPSVDWALDLPTDAMAEKAGRALDEELESAKSKSPFRPVGTTKATFFIDIARRPGFFFKTHGSLDKVCGGLDIRAEINIALRLSVSAPNTVRLDGLADIDLNDWDSAKCTFLSLLNPISGLITTVDTGLPWWVPILFSPLLPSVPLVFGFGLDDLAVDMAIEEVRENLKDNSPAIVQTSATTFHAELERKVTTALTRDWIVVESIAGVGTRLLLSGSFRAPDVSTLPRLRGTLADDFGSWRKKDRCSSNPKYVSSATISLALEDPVTGTPVHPPPLPVRYAINLEEIGGKKVEVGETTWYVIDDPHGVYRGARTRIRWIGGVPGTFEVEIENPPDPYASAPYPFQMRIFTSVGVREFVIPAPPRLPKPPETREAKIAEEAGRISDCYIFSSLLTMVKALQVHWLPTPQPGARVGQHWQVLVRGLSAQDRLVAWDLETREILAEVRAYNGGLAEISLVMPPERPMRGLQLTLNDAPFLEESAYRAQTAAIQGKQETGPTPVLIRQTPLYRVREIELRQPASAVSAFPAHDALQMLVQTDDGVAQFDVDLRDLTRAPRYSRLASAPELDVQLPSLSYRIARNVTCENTTVEIIGPGLEHHGVIARYYARPWYDRGSIAGRFLAQLDDAGRKIFVYHYGATVEAEPEVGERDYAAT